MGSRSRSTFTIFVVGVACIPNLASALSPSSLFGGVENSARGASRCLFSRRYLTASDDSSNTSWLKDAMGNNNPDKPMLQIVSAVSPGISGFAVDPELGFVAVLGEEKGVGQRATYAVIAPSDTERVSAPEALCLVQLAGGMDLGVTVFPPDLLAQLVADEIDGCTEDLRPRISLAGVEAVPNEDWIDNNSDKTNDSNVAENPSSPERNAKINEAAQKSLASVKRLPGLGECSLDEVIVAMGIHANDSGVIDRQAFSEVLGTLRQFKTNIKPSMVNFLLTISIIDGDSISQKTLTTCAFNAIALAMRYKITVSVSEETAANGFEATNVSSRFPDFRPINELVEDAKITEGFIPSMFSKVAPNSEQKI